MRKGILALGIVLIIVGLILAIVFYPLVGYATAEETSDEISEFSTESLSGKSVKFKGTVDDVWTDEIPYVSDLFELVGLLVFSVDGLEVETFIGGLFGSEETVPVIIFSDNMDVEEGDEVTVEGYAFGWSDISVIIGESGFEAVSGFFLFGSSPDAADVEFCPQAGCYFGIALLIIGFILVIVGAVLKPKGQAQQYYQQPQAQPARPVQPAPPVAAPVKKEYPPPPPAAAPQQPPPPPQGPQYPCRWCEQPMNFVDQYQRWYCGRCQRYA